MPLTVVELEQVRKEFEECGGAMSHGTIRNFVPRAIDDLTVLRKAEQNLVEWRATMERELEKLGQLTEERDDARRDSARLLAALRDAQYRIPHNYRTGIPQDGCRDSCARCKIIAAMQPSLKPEPTSASDS